MVEQPLCDLNTSSVWKSPAVEKEEAPSQAKEPCYHEHMILEVKHRILTMKNDVLKPNFGNTVCGISL